MKKYTLVIFIMLAVTAFSKQGFANNGNNNSNNNTTTALETCELTDLVMSDTSEADVIGCAGQIEGNDATTENWLETQEIWDANDILTNAETAGTTDKSWIFFTKYDADEGKFTSNGWTGSLTFANCKDSGGQSISCDSQWNVADITFSFDNVLYDQFVVLNKAGNYFSLYQVDLLANVSQLTGTLTTVSQQALSHLTLWAREITDGSVTEVSSPAALSLFILGLLALVFSKRRAISR